MEDEQRRLIRRHMTDWRGKYMIEGDLEDRWRDCRVIDTSAAGVGLELLDASPTETDGCRVVLALQLRVEIRHSREVSEGRMRVGAQFVELTDRDNE